ncbi:MAG TPA: metallophosphoesterase [Blastocatellia bacterium]|nr:metallophosphoesterase [Blastocatellia bacterium]
METAGTYRVLIFLAVVGTVYVLAAGILVRRVLRRFRSIGTPFNKAQTWYSRVVLGLAGIGILCGAYGYFIEPYWPSVRHVQIESPKLPEGTGPIRIVLISDLHSDAKPRLEERLPVIVAQENPDLILFAGDCVNSVEGVPVFKKCMTGLAELAPTFAVRGNWDAAFWRNVDLFGGTGVKELDGLGIDLDIRGATISVSGLAIGHEAQIDNVVGRMPSEAFTLFLYHYPDELDDVSSHRIDLYCAGHTHGGQVSLPWYGALVTLSKFDKKYEAGFYRKQDTALYVNRGIGMEGGHAPRVRFCARPEVTVIDVVSAARRNGSN